MKEGNWPEESELKFVMGNGCLGIVPLPSADDRYQQPSVNFYPSKRRRKGDDDKLSGGSHRQIELLVFGGTRFSTHVPNEFYEFSDRCFRLSIPPNSDTYELTYLPGAKLACPDKFFSNMQVRCDQNQNTVTVFGNKAAHRINTGKRDPTHL